MRNYLIIIFIACWSIGAFASNQFIFYYYPDENGRPRHLPEFEGPYLHVAMETKGGWLHAHPFFGVQVEREIPKMGPEYHRIKLPKQHFVQRARFKQFLGISFDREYIWGVDSGIYCSELFGFIFGIAPTPMEDRPEELGLSPTEIYHFLVEELGAKSED